MCFLCPKQKRMVPWQDRHTWMVQSLYNMRKAKCADLKYTGDGDKERRLLYMYSGQNV